MPSMIKVQQIKHEHESSRSVTKPKLDEAVIQVKYHLTRLQNMKPPDLVMTSWKNKHTWTGWMHRLKQQEKKKRKKKKRENKTDGSHDTPHTYTLTCQSMKGTKKKVSRNVSGG